MDKVLLEPVNWILAKGLIESASWTCRVVSVTNLVETNTKLLTTILQQFNQIAIDNGLFFLLKVP